MHILVTPNALAVRIHIKPIGPAPQMRTVWPAVTEARLQAWRETESGSMRAPSSSETWSGSLEDKRCKFSPSLSHSSRRSCVYLLKTVIRRVLEVPGKASVVRRGGGEENVRTQVVVTFFTSDTVSARNPGLDSDSITRPEVFDGLTDSDHNSAGFMTQYHWLFDYEVANVTFGPVMYIWTAYSNLWGLQKYLLRGEIGLANTKRRLSRPIMNLIAINYK